MWRRWSKSSVQKTHPSNSSLSSASFKDIQNLCAPADGGDSRLPNTKISYVFHRVRAANSVLRSFSSSTRSDSGPQSVIKTRPPSPPPQSTLPQSELRKSPPPPPTLPQLELQKSPPPPPPQTTIPQSELQKSPPHSPPPPSIAIPGAEKRIFVYFTSLRVVRSTFEDCRFVQSILRAFRVSIDERDLAMDSGFIKELQQIFGGGGGQRKLTLPCVFIGGRYIGGADEIRDLHDAGELKKLVVGLAAPEPGGVCDVCGGYRFVLCTDCNGSHKMYVEKFGFKSCVSCNENGLVRCSSCSVQSSLDTS